jgi:hypothetical protein
VSIRFEDFQQRVFEDESLQAELIQPAELAAFCTAVVAAGKRCGFAFAEDEVLAAYRQSRSAWLMREAL